MGLISFTQKGDFKNTEKFLHGDVTSKYVRILERYGEEGVKALSAATPVDTGETANSWSYDIRISAGSATISWNNSNIVDKVPIAIILQYGHGTRNGGYVFGQDYINPAIRPIFDKIANDVWREVTK